MDIRQAAGFTIWKPGNETMSCLGVFKLGSKWMHTYLPGTARGGMKAKSSYN